MRLHPADGNDGGLQPCVGGEEPVVAMTVDARRGDEAREPLEQLEGGEQERAAALEVGLR